MIWGDLVKVLVTGGAGYVGSCICQALIKSGHVPIILDSLLSGRNCFVDNKNFYKADIGNLEVLAKIFDEHPDIEAMIHYAERAMVGNSVKNPYDYYISNVSKSIEVCNFITEAGCKKMIYCSTGAIYEDVAGYMVSESSPIKPRSPFARSKYITEMVLEDFCAAYDIRCIALRYFNPIGASPDMSAGPEASNSGNIVSKILEAVHNSTNFIINGDDWATKDGTCIRDYLHVWDLAMAHVKAIENFDRAFRISESAGYLPINIGSGKGASVKEVITAFENVSGDKVKVKIGPRRPGDTGGAYASTNLARDCIEWRAELSMEEAILDAIRWEDKRRGR